jgi:hypothetical protein
MEGTMTLIDRLMDWLPLPVVLRWQRIRHPEMYRVDQRLWEGDPQGVVDGSGRCSHDECRVSRWYVQNRFKYRDDPRITRLTGCPMFVEWSATAIEAYVPLPPFVADYYGAVRAIVSAGLALIDNPRLGLSKLGDAAVSAAESEHGRRLFEDQRWVDTAAAELMLVHSADVSPATAAIDMMALAIMRLDTGGPTFDPAVRRGEEILAKAFGLEEA